MNEASDNQVMYARRALSVATEAWAKRGSPQDMLKSYIDEDGLEALDGLLMGYISLVNQVLADLPQVIETRATADELLRSLGLFYARLDSA